VSFRSSSKHCVGESNYHFQFTPKYRREAAGRGIRAIARSPFHRRLLEMQCFAVGVVLQRSKLQRAAQKTTGISFERRSGARRCGAPATSMTRSAGLRFNRTLNFKLPFKSKTIKHCIERQQGKHWASSYHRDSTKKKPCKGFRMVGFGRSLMLYLNSQPRFLCLLSYRANSEPRPVKAF